MGLLEVFGLLTYVAIILAIIGASMWFAGRFAWTLLRRGLPEPISAVLMIPIGFAIFVFAWLPFVLVWAPVRVIQVIARRERQANAIGPLLVLLGVMGLLALAFAYGAAGGSIDPTDPANFNQFSFVNTRKEPVRLSECAGSPCVSTYDSGVTVEPGKSTGEEVAWGDSSQQGFRIQSRTGAIIGCIWLTAPRKVSQTVTVSLSKLQACTSPAS